jgi:hypothetical protein
MRFFSEVILPKVPTCTLICDLKQFDVVLNLLRYSSFRSFHTMGHCSEFGNALWATGHCSKFGYGLWATVRYEAVQ